MQAHSIILHYFILAAFAWMLVEGLEVYRAFVQVMPQKQKSWHTTATYASAWLVPAGVVLVSAVSSHERYFSSTSCWIDMDTPLRFAFYLPVAVCLGFNIVVFVMSVRHISKDVGGKVTFIAAASFFTMFGLTWYVSHL